MKGRDNFGRFLKGHKFIKECILRGKKHPCWKGDKAGLTALHDRVRKARGRPKFCEMCGTKNKRKRYEWANLTGKYTNIMDYKQMCKSCHIKFDGSAYKMLKTKRKNKKERKKNAKRNSL